MMPAHTQRHRLATVLKWARAVGWERGPYPGQYRSGRRSISYQSNHHRLTVDHREVQIGWVNRLDAEVSSIDQAINFLATLELVPESMCGLYGAGLADGIRYRATRDERIIDDLRKMAVSA